MTEPIGYTAGEVRASLAPFFGLEMEEISHFAIMVKDETHNKARVIGCAHVPEFLSSVEAANFNSSPHYHSGKSHARSCKGNRWLEIPVLRMLFRRDHSA